MTAFLSQRQSSEYITARHIYALVLLSTKHLTSNKSVGTWKRSRGKERSEGWGVLESPAGTAHCSACTGGRPRLVGGRKQLGKKGGSSTRKHKYLIKARLTCEQRAWRALTTEKYPFPQRGGGHPRLLLYSSLLYGGSIRWLQILKTT